MLDKLLDALGKSARLLPLINTASSGEDTVMDYQDKVVLQELIFFPPATNTGFDR